MDKMNNGTLIKVIERVPLSQNAFLAIVTIDGKPYVVSCSEKQIQILKELDEDVLLRAKKPLNWASSGKSYLTLAEVLNKIKGRIQNEKNN